MKRISDYHLLIDPEVKMKKYFLVLLLSILFLFLVMSLKIERNIILKLTRVEENVFQVYLNEETLSMVRKEKVMIVGNKKIHYTMDEKEEEIEEIITFQNDRYTLVTLHLKEKCREKIITSRVLISRKTYFERLIALWKGEIE